MIYRNIKNGLLLVTVMLFVLCGVLAVGRMNTSAASSAMTTSSDGVALIASFEGCRLTAYDDLQPNVTLTADTVIKGTLTIGYGHTGTVDGEAIAWNTTITQAKAEELLASDLLVFETSVNNLASDNGLTFTQNQFDALVSFTYNVGQNKWTNGSTFQLKTYLLNGIENYSNYEVTSAFVAFNKSGGTVLNGLTRRRKKEAAMFLGNPTIASNGPGTYVVFSESLNVRSGPSSSYSKVTTLSEGDQITITETSGYWGKYSDGWVSLDYCICLCGSLDTPALSSISVTNSGIKITWQEVEDAAMYQILRKSGSGSWVKVATTTSLSYTDKSSLTSNTVYTYTVRCVTSDGAYSESSYDKTGLSAEYYSAPTLTSISNTNSGIKVKWNAVDGATCYRIYRKTSGSDGWETLADTTSTSYTDTTVQSGVTYSYTVRCMNSTGKKSAGAYDTTGLSIYRILAPELTSISNTSSGVKLKWNTVSNASKYRIYRKTSSTGTWKKLADTTSANYTDTTVKTGTTYYYTVRVYSTDGSASAYDSTGLTLMRLLAPEITKISNTSSGVKITWDSAKKASQYFVYRRTSTTGTWKKIAATTSTNYTDKSVSAGKTYYYTVKTINSSSQKSAIATSVSLMRMEAPEITKISNTSSGVKVTWASAKQASNYYIYRRTSTTGSWKKIATTTTTSYTDKNVSAGKTYYYTVKAVNSSKTTSVNASSVSLMRLEAPEITKISNTSSGVKVTWDTAKKASEYYVYRKTSASGSWKKVKTTTSTSYTDKDVTAGKTYYYTVKAVNSSGKTSANAGSVKIVRLTTPSLTKAASTSSGVKITWGKVTKATNYRVYRRSSTSGSWTKIADTTSTSYTDKTAVSGKTYYYTVRAYSNNGSYYSSYDSSGLKIKYNKPES